MSADRATLVVNTRSWHGRLWFWWTTFGGKKTGPSYRENLCHYVRVVGFWAPLRAFVSLHPRRAPWLRPVTVVGSALVAGVITAASVLFPHVMLWVGVGTGSALALVAACAVLAYLVDEFSEPLARVLEWVYDHLMTPVGHVFRAGYRFLDRHDTVVFWTLATVWVTSALYSLVWVFTVHTGEAIHWTWVIAACAGGLVLAIIAAIGAFMGVGYVLVGAQDAYRARQAVRANRPVPEKPDKGPGFVRVGWEVARRQEAQGVPVHRGPAVTAAEAAELAEVEGMRCERPDPERPFTIGVLVEADGFGHRHARDELVRELTRALSHVTRARVVKIVETP